MRLLLDTHILLWFLSAAPALPERLHRLIEDPGNDVLVSVASLWEIAIKVSLGKLELMKPFTELFPAHLEQDSIDILPIRIAHLVTLSTLPFHHRDPFDRLIIAQCLTERLTLVTADQALDSYNVVRA